MCFRLLFCAFLSALSLAARSFPIFIVAQFFQEFARTALNWPDLFDSIASLIERRLRTSFDEPKLAAL
jgi:hypothetical protein